LLIHQIGAKSRLDIAFWGARKISNAAELRAYRRSLFEQRQDAVPYPPPRLGTTTHPVGGSSRAHRLRKLDGRRREAKRLQAIKNDLAAHLGGWERVSVAQRYLIERAAIDILRLELLDAEMATGTFSEHDGRVAHALRNSVRLMLRDLGWKAAAPTAPTLADYLTQYQAEHTSDAAE
jgi:hypothetical protein